MAGGPFGPDVSDRAFRTGRFRPDVSDRTFRTGRANRSYGAQLLTKRQEAFASAFFGSAAAGTFTASAGAGAGLAAS